MLAQNAVKVRCGVFPAYLVSGTNNKRDPGREKFPDIVNIAGLDRYVGPQRLNDSNGAAGTASDIKHSCVFWKIVYECGKVAFIWREPLQCLFASKRSPAV
ncbi:MAG: hypothetical protein WAN50_04055 [Minisyncoccia bacterium]